MFLDGLDRLAHGGGHEKIYDGMPKKKKPKAKRARTTKKAPAARDCRHLPARTELEQTAHLGGDLRDAWAALRRALAELGPAEVRTSHHAVVFARKS